MFAASKSGKAAGAAVPVSATDAQFKYVTTLLTGNGTNGATNGGSATSDVPSVVFDASTNNANISASGDVKPNRFNPVQEGYYSNSFNGSTDYLSAPSSSQFNLTGDFTIECWIYKNTTANAGIFGIGTTDPNSNLIRTVSSKLQFWLGGSNSGGPGSGTKTGQITCATTLANNVWYHIALVRSGSATNNVKLYLNGIIDGQGTGTYQTGANALVIGRTYPGFSEGYFPGLISNFRVVNGTAVYTANFTPSTAPLTAISGTILLTCQSSRFADTGPFAQTLTTSGTPSISALQPFGSATAANVPNFYSTKFNGTTDYLTTPNNANLSMGTGDFTIEGWFYSGSTATNGLFQIASTAGGFGGVTGIALGVKTGKYSVYYNNGSSADSTGLVISPNAWHHFAVVKSNNITKIYLDGILDTGLGTAGSITDTTSYTGTYLTVGGFYSSTYVWNGYISNLRVVKGTAVYTANFTPSTAPLTAVAGTSLLTCQDATLKDNSTNAFTITSAGSAQPVPATPFLQTYTQQSAIDYGSAYFDGTGDYLTVPSSAVFSIGTGDFTWEAWVNIQSLSSTRTIYDTLNGGDTGGTGRFAIQIDTGGTTQLFTGAGSIFTSGGTVRTNTWTHVAYSRASASGRLFINGVQVNTTYSDTTNYVAGTSNRPIIGINGYDASTNPMLGYISNLRVVKGTALYASNFQPPASPLTAVTNTQLLTLQTNGAVNDSGFLDSSPNNLTVARFGNVTQGSQAPFGANWSNSFTGSGTYLGVPGTIALGAANFTLEFWFYFNNADSTRFDMMGTDFVIYRYSDNVLSIYTTASGGNIIDVPSFTRATYGNRWLHFAVSRSSNVTKLFINGTQVGNTYTDNNNYSFANPYIGDNPGASSGINGYMSNFRIVAGTALYTANFTPPTAPLTAITGTKLLTCQNPNIVDNGPSAIAITATGTPQVQRFSPFSNVLQTPLTYSTKFNGSTDYLNIATVPSSFLFGTGDFTVETWVNFTVDPTTGMVLTGNFNNNTNAYGVWTIYYYGNTKNLAFFYASGGMHQAAITFTANKWYHIAVTRSGTSLKIFVDGNVIGTFTNSWDINGAEAQSGGWYIGRSNDSAAYFPGYLSNLRVVKGTALYTSAFTPPTAPLTAISGTSLLTCQDATIRDNSTNALAITATGSPTPKKFNPFGYTTSTAQTYNPQVHGGSMYFDGAGDYLTAPANTGLTLGTSDYTVECWVNLQGTQTTTYGWGVFGTYPGSGTGWSMTVNRSSGGQGIIWILGGAIVAGYTASYIPLNAWTHIAVTRSGTGTNNTKIFLNGTVVTQVTDNTNDTWSGVTYFGGQGTGQLMTGYISNARVVKGTALYTSNFVPPLAPVTAVTGTQLLLNGTNAAVYDSAMQTTIETIGNAQISTTQKKFGTGSIYFDGTGDYLTCPATTTLAARTGDFTLELWAYHLDTGVYATYFQQGNAGGGIIFRRNDTNKLELSHNAVVAVATSTATIPSNQWTHIALSRSGTTIRTFIDGVIASTVTYAGDFNDMTTHYVGTTQAIAGYYMKGYIDDLRFTKGYARYTANFTPPATALPTQ